MRVIAGTYRSRVLAAPRGSATRPTSDRLRETLFNILAPRIEGARFADLYAGSGAVGIEAISRGAAHVYFAERAEPAVAAIRSNLASLRLTQGFTVDPRSAAAFLDSLADRAAKTSASALLDVVFLDPPWEAAAEYSSVLGQLGSRTGRQLLSPGAVTIVEHSCKTAVPTSIGDLTQTRTLKQGDAALTFYTRTEKQEVEAATPTRNPSA
jgi:16S rRNA (guanine966-N2)-methyltransferase